MVRTVGLAPPIRLPDQGRSGGGSLSATDHSCPRFENFADIARHPALPLILSITHKCHGRTLAQCWWVACHGDGALHFCHSRAWLPREESRTLGLALVTPGSAPAIPG